MARIPVRLSALLVFVVVCMASTPPLAAPTHEGKRRESISGSDVYEKVSPSVVTVRARLLDGVSQGSGVVIGNGRIVTNHHVVENTDSAFLIISQGSRQWRALVVASDASTDLALLEVLTPPGERFDLPVSETRASGTVKVGERVYAVGSPLGIENTLSEGIVSGIKSFDDGSALLQTNAAISHGSSGGGLFDSGGRLVGVTAITIDGAQNLNFAIPAESIRLLELSLPKRAAPLEFPEQRTGVEEGKTPTPPPPASLLPMALSRLPGLVVEATSSDELARYGLTNDAVRSMTVNMLRRSGIRVFPTFDSALKAGSAATLSVSVDSFMDENRVQHTYVAKVKLQQWVDFYGQDPGPVTTWEMEHFGYAGITVVAGAVRQALLGQVDKFCEDVGSAKSAANGD